MCSQRLCTASMENSFSSLRESRTKKRCSEARQRQAWLSDVISKECIVSAKGAASIRARGNAPGARSSIKTSAESAFQTGGWFSIPNVARNTHGLLYNQNVH